MGREVRMVPANWQHPRSSMGKYNPLMDGYESACEVREEEMCEYPDHAPDRPDPKEYMPVFRADKATHYMMYETITKGTPISPAFETPELLAAWLVANKANAGAGYTATYEA
jgi:hypothetical protein